MSATGAVFPNDENDPNLQLNLSSGTGQSYSSFTLTSPPRSTYSNSSSQNGTVDGYDSSYSDESGQSSFPRRDPNLPPVLKGEFTLAHLSRLLRLRDEALINQLIILRVNLNLSTQDFYDIVYGNQLHLSVHGGKLISRLVGIAPPQPGVELVSHLSFTGLLPQLHNLTDLRDFVGERDPSQRLTWMKHFYFNHAYLFDRINSQADLQYLLAIIPDKDKEKANLTQWLLSNRIEKTFNDGFILMNFKKATMEQRNRFQEAHREIKEKAIKDCIRGEMPLESALQLASAAHALISCLQSLTMDNKAAIAAITKFRESTAAFEVSWGWRAVLGAFIMAAVGVVGGIALTTSGPLAFLALEFGAMEAATLSAALFGTAGAALGFGLGLWRDRCNDKVHEYSFAAEGIVTSLVTP